jgi:S-formylglutathione hydrolase FrmB
LLSALVAAAVVVGASVGSSAASSSAPGPVFGDEAGVHVLAAQQIDPRQWNVQVLSGALGRPVNVRVLLPLDYAQTPTRHYPVLYLFHGTSGQASDWVNQGNAEATTAGLPLIVVMPDAGFDGDGGGWFTNWYDTHTRLGPSQWETFHVDQLIPWVDHNLRTVAQRQGRAIAGLSQGGFGALSYAARHPDTFISAGSFSGAPDIDYNPIVAVGATAVIEATAVGLDGVEPDAMFGSRLTNEINWQGHDPADLAANLRGMDLSLFTATGVPGPLDPPVPNPTASVIEAITHVSTMSFYQRLGSLGIPSHLDDYVFGTHTFPYWARDLRQFVGPLMQTFAHPPAPPRNVSYASIDQHWSQWGWSVSVQRVAPQELSSLSNAGPNGFTLRGTGRAAVTTPAVYRPHSPATVTYSGTAGSGVLALTTDSAGRLPMSLPLGDSGLRPGVTTVGIQGPRA